MNFLKKYILLWLLISFQIALILFLLVWILNKKQYIQSKLISQKSVVFSSTSTLKYFYEPRENFIEHEDFRYLSFAKDAQYHFNKNTFNDRFDYDVKKSKEVYRIITLGDSMTFGLYVDTKYSWPELLEDKLNRDGRYEVINLGVYGYDISYAAKRYEKRGKKYHSDMIIWFISNHDMVQLNEKLLEKDYALRRELRKKGEFQKKVENNEFFPSRVQAHEQVLKELGEENIKDYHLELFESFRKEYKGTLIFMLNPGFNGANEKRIKQFVESHKNTYYLWAPDIYKDSSLYFPDKHPTRAGNKLIAERVSLYIKELLNK